MGAQFDQSELDNIKPGLMRYMTAHPVAANLLMIILIIGGGLILWQSKKEIFPEFSLDRVIVTMVYPGANPAEVEQGIVLPIENALEDIEGIKDMSSSASEAYGHVIVEIEDADETIRVLQDVKTAVDQISTFPVDAENLSVSILENQETVMHLVLYGDVNENVLRESAENLRRSLENHDGISLVDPASVRDYEIHIEVPQDTLRRYNLSIPDISQTIARTSLELGGGAIKTSSGEILVQMTERRNYAREFEDIPIIKNESGGTVYLGNIATVTDTFEDRNVFARYNGKPAIELVISSTADQTPTGISSAVHEVINGFEQSAPDALNVTVIRDTSIMFQERAELLIKNGLFGLFLVVIILTLFLDVRLAFWVSMGIPISYMGAFILLSMTDFSINMVSMFAFIIALGIVVDDAVVVGENIYHKREGGMKPLEASVTGAREIAIPVFVSVLTNIVAFLPMLFMPGFMGKIFAIIPLIVICTFILSLLESLLILPAHLTFKQSKHIKNRGLLCIVNFQKAFNRKFNSFVSNYYVPFLRKTVSLRYIALSFFLAILIYMGGYTASGRLGIQMFPSVEADYAFAQATLVVGSPEEDVLHIENKLINAANEIVAENGGDALSTGIYSQIDENEIELSLYLTPSDVRPITTQKVADLWRKKVGNIEGLESLQFMADRDGPGAGKALTVELSHENTETLEQAAVEFAQELELFPSTQDIDDGTAQGKRQFDFTMTDLGYSLGLTPAEVGRQVRAAFRGSEAFKQQRGRHEVRTLVMLPEEERDSAYVFQNMMIKAPNGSFVRVSDVVQAHKGRAYTTIDRREGRRVITVSADVDPPSETNALIAAITSDTLPKLQARYSGLTYSFEGEQADMGESMESLGYGMIAIVFVMYAILAVLFSSYSQPLLIMIAIPFSIVGAIIGHYIMGFPVSIVSMFGIIALAGVVINGSLILIDMANIKRRAGEDAFSAVVMAAQQRFRPIILTTLTTFVGLAPMMFETSRQARFLIPMAISLGYGIVFSTFLTLILIPSLYMINEDIKRMFAAFWRALIGR